MGQVIGEPTDSEKRSFSYAPYDPLPLEGTYGSPIKLNFYSFFKPKNIKT